MKTVDPNMKLDRQVRKAIGPIDTDLSNLIHSLKCMGELGVGDFSEGIKTLQKARYSMDLINQMVKSACDGQPRPWSEFSPMIDEEFG